MSEPDESVIMSSAVTVDGIEWRVELRCDPKAEWPDNPPEWCVFRNGERVDRCSPYIWRLLSDAKGHYNAFSEASVRSFEFSHESIKRPDITLDACEHPWKLQMEFPCEIDWCRICGSIRENPELPWHQPLRR